MAEKMMNTFSGISEKEVPSLQKIYGKNVFRLRRQNRLFKVLAEIISEPMLILLLFASTLYFVLGEYSEGFTTLTAVILVACISIYQGIKSTNAIEALKDLTSPKVTVIRDGVEKPVSTADIVPGDIILLQEGNTIPADAVIVQQNDLSVNESILTGESLPVDKNDTEGNNILFHGSTINSGQCYAKVTATGNATALGKLGKSVTSYAPVNSLLQKQINNFVRRLAFFGVLGFLIIWGVNFLETGDLTTSLLFGLTLAMASIPEEIPVAFSSFMALGAYHMSRLGIITMQPQTIESLGAISVICLDKTGTITENKMQVKEVYDFKSARLHQHNEFGKTSAIDVIRYAALASEFSPFDAMEKAINDAYQLHAENADVKRDMIHEYPLEGKPPMMTHVYRLGDKRMVAGKGAAERIFKVCCLDPLTLEAMHTEVEKMASRGFRVIAVASAVFSGENYPDSQDGFDWQFEGILGLYDPPKKNVEEVFGLFRKAGISVKMITGDYPATALTIAKQAGIRGDLKFITGDEVMRMDNSRLKKVAENISIYARMFPEAKLKVIEALKERGEIVAMTGDGVNDAPALKAAHVGIAMGKRGAELAREVSDIILTDDNLNKVLDAIQQGRKIYNNLLKAIRYIISIHIPIILTASLPLLFGWKYPNIFTPIHVIFLELIMGPTCSIFFEREPVEADLMLRKPRDRSKGLFSKNQLSVSIVQGLAISTAVLSMYYFYIQSGRTLEETRTVVFATLILSNIFLTFTNRSFSKTFFTTIKYKNVLSWPVFIASATFLFIFLLVTPVRDMFGLSRLHLNEFALCLGIAFTSVVWFECYKYIKHKVH